VDPGDADADSCGPAPKEIAGLSRLERIGAALPEFV
jgi:hypothetical protein